MLRKNALILWLLMVVSFQGTQAFSKRSDVIVRVKLQDQELAALVTVAAMGLLVAACFDYLVEALGIRVTFTHETTYCYHRQHCRGYVCRCLRYDDRC